MSELDISISSKFEKRRCERNHIQQNIKLHIEDLMLSCISTDISLGGIALDCDSPVPDDICHKKAFFYLDDSETKFNCTVIRNKENYIAIELDKKQAAIFGKQLTKKLLDR